MQIFIPFPSVRRSLRYLARYPRRLFAQLREGTHTLLAIRGTPVVRSHPQHTVTRSWKDNELFLRYYLCRCSDTIKARTHRKKDGKPYDTSFFDARIKKELGGWVDQRPPRSARPVWWGRKDIHDSYKAMLYRKNSDLYPNWQRHAEQYEDYVWPVEKRSKGRRSKVQT